MARGGMRNLPI